MKPTLFQQVKPHLIAILIFLVVTLVYFSPLLQGKVLNQHDISQWAGMAKEIQDFRDKTGQEALWTNSMFGGMPAYQISVLYPSNLVQYVYKALTLGLPSPADLLFICLLGFYILLISIKTDYRLAIAGAFAYAFCSYFLIIIQAGHNTKAIAIAFMPMVMAGVIMAYRGRYLFGAGLAALSLALQIYANHLQITYYLALAIIVFAICELIASIREKRFTSFIKPSIYLLMAALLAVLPNITNLWATYEYGEYSTRGPSELTEKKISTGLDKDYALDWSYGILETMTLLIPDFKGGSSMYELDQNSETYKALQQNTGAAQAKSFTQRAPLYWGDQPSTSGPVYNGAIPFFLFILSLFILRGPYRWWIIAAALLSVMLSWGRHFPVLTDFFFDNVPGYNKFRAVSMTLVIVSFIIPVAAILAVRKFMEWKDTAKLKQHLKYAFYISGGFCLLFILLPGLFCDFEGQSDEAFKQYDWLLTALKADRESILRMDAFRSLFFISAGFALLWFTLSNKVKPVQLYMGLALLILIDMWGVDKRYLNADDFETKSRAEQVFEPTEADRRILQDQSYFRVMNTTVSTFNDATTSYFHKSIGGYHGAKLKRYQELIEYQIAKNNMEVLNMLNTKYIISADQQQRPVVQQNPGAAGNAWFVKGWKIVPDADAEMKAMDNLDLSIAIIDKRYEPLLQGAKQDSSSNGTITLDSYAPNALKYTSNSSSNQLAVFSEIHYPEGWNAYVDGKLQDHLRVNYVLRGLVIPTGKHTIEFKFEPEVYATGEKIALAGSLAVLLLFAFSGFKEWKESNENLPEKK